MNRCRALAADEKAGKLERVRAEMLPFEILWYGRRSEESIQAAEAFIQKYAGTEYKEEVAMAHFFAGWQLAQAGRDAEALPHFREVIRLMPGQEMLFRTDAIPRSYYNVWRILHAAKAPKEEIDAAAQAFSSAFPESDFLHTIRTVQEREEGQK